MGRKPIDLTGQHIGMLTVIRRVPDPQKKKVLWECKCDCGNTCVRSAILLTHDISISCGCVRRGKSGLYTPKKPDKPRNRGYSHIDYTGQTFGNLTGIQVGHNGEWLWRCACGNLIFATASEVVGGIVKSCGCLPGDEDRRIVDPPKAEATPPPEYTDKRMAPRATNGSPIARLRVERGLTQTQLANMIGARLCTVSRWELGAVNPSKEYLIKLSAALNCTISEILGLTARSRKRSEKLIDLSGQRFGALTVTRKAPRKNGRTYWNCHCDCGNNCVQDGSNLRRGIVTSCGCGLHRASLRKGIETGMQVDYTGQTFGRLTAIRRVAAGEWLWKCECGKETIAKPADVKKGNPASCGCGLKEASRKRIVEDNAMEFFDGTSVSNLRSIVAGKKRSTNTSGYTGVKVRHNKSGDTYVAQIMVRGKQINLGTFSTLEEAAEARKAAEKQYFEKIINEYDRRKDDDG